jgi:hypothetical protein
MALAKSRNRIDRGCEIARAKIKLAVESINMSAPAKRCQAPSWLLLNSAPKTRLGPNAWSRKSLKE